MNKRLLLVAPVLFVAALWFIPTSCTPYHRDNVLDQATRSFDTRSPDAQLEYAFENRLTHHLLGGRGTVTKLLGDDNQGRRHQRFILRVGSGRSLLVSHNLDLSRRIEELRVGDAVSFYGEYEWNEKGGVIHWTHHDPEGRHPAGWINHRGQMYQ